MAMDVEPFAGLIFEGTPEQFTDVGFSLFQAIWPNCERLGPGKGFAVYAANVNRLGELASLFDYIEGPSSQSSPICHIMPRPRHGGTCRVEVKCIQGIPPDVMGAIQNFREALRGDGWLVDTPRAQEASASKVDADAKSENPRKPRKFGNDLRRRATIAHRLIETSDLKQQTACDLAMIDSHDYRDCRKAEEFFSEDEYLKIFNETIGNAADKLMKTK
jgi:hypothetical protein